MTSVEPTTNQPTARTEERSRRDVLCGLVVALLAPGALAAACGDDSSGDSDNGGYGGDQNGDRNGGGDQNGGDPTQGGGSAEGLAAVDDVPEGGGLIVDHPDGSKVLLVRSSGQDVTAFNASCTHQGTTVEAPVDGTATCPNHGSQFDVETGEATNGPATRPLAEVAVSVANGQIVLA